MFDSIGFQELFLIGLVALLVVGPKDLPLLARKMGRWTKKIQGMAMEFRASFDDLARQAELDELRKEVESLRTMKPLQELNETLNERVEIAPEMRAKVPSGAPPAPDTIAAQVDAPAAVAGPEPKPAKPKKPRAPRKPKAAEPGIEPAGGAS
jgi:sec-independent protein translocase protein TatB